MQGEQDPIEIEEARDEWANPLRRHRAAVMDYLRLASGLEEAAWRLPVEAGKWTPAEITDHLLRTYRLALDQVRGGPGLKMRTGFLLRHALRLVLLPRIFRNRRLPRGAKAPFEIRPADSGISRETALRQLDALGGEFEREIWSRRTDPGLRLTHHIFGALKSFRALDFIAIHTEHHARQLPRE